MKNMTTQEIDNIVKAISKRVIGEVIKIRIGHNLYKYQYTGLCDECNNPDCKNQYFSVNAYREKDVNEIIEGVKREKK